MTALRAHRPRAGRVAALAAGAAGATAAFLALASIPRGAGEFLYCPTGNPLDTLRPLPFAAMNGFTPEQLSSHLARLVLLGPALLLLGWAVGPACLRLARRLPEPRVSALAGALLVALVALAVLRGVPTQDDEPTYLMQAESVARGRLFEPPVPPDEQWREPFTIFTSRATTGKYLFGEPLVLAPGVLLGAPVLGHVVLVGLTVSLFAALLVREAGREVAALGALLLALSPQVAFTSAQALSQPTALALVVAAFWGARRGGAAGGWIAGTALGFAMAVRPQMAVPCGAALLLLHLRERRMLLHAVLAGLPWVAAILLYNHAVTGDPLRLPWDVWFPERFGFGRPFGTAIPYEHTPAAGLAQGLVVLTRLNGWGLGWPVSLLGPALWLALGRPHRAAVKPWAWIAAATFLLQLAFRSPGTSDTGAIYHHAALPFLAASTAAAVAKLLESRHAATAAGVLAVSLVLGTGSFFVEQGLRLRRLTDTLAEPYRDVAPASPAIVFVEVVPPERGLLGWLNGVAYRSRHQDEPVVYYPLWSGPGGPALRHAKATAAGRECLVRRFDPRQGAFVTEGCDLLPAYFRSYSGRVEAAADWKEARGLDAGGRPGAWRRAFPWLGSFLETDPAGGAAGSARQPDRPGLP